MTTTIAIKKKLGTQENNHNHDDGKEERNQKHKRMKTTMPMVRRSATKNTRRGLRRWPKRGNQKHNKDDHEHGNG